MAKFDFDAHAKASPFFQRMANETPEKFDAFSRYMRLHVRAREGEALTVSERQELLAAFEAWRAIVAAPPTQLGQHSDEHVALPGPAHTLQG